MKLTLSFSQAVFSIWPKSPKEIWISWQRKEHFRWNKRHFVSLLKGFLWSKQINSFGRYEYNFNDDDEDDGDFFCGMVERRKAFSLISSRDHCQRSSPSRISYTPQAGLEPAQNLSSGLVEWICAVVITTTPRRKCFRN